LIISQIIFEILGKIMLFCQSIFAINRLTLQIMEIIQNIKNIRLQRNITQEVMAESLSIDVAGYNRIENGKQELKVSQLENIANLLKLRVIDLFTFPEVYELRNKQNSTKVTVEFDVSANEMLNLCLKDKILQVLEKE
jgi:transcriptional regulator with XRE-family HTH domain